MTDAPGQDPLFAQPKPVIPLRELTDRQQSIYRLICSVPGGVEAIQLGALIHAGQGRHAAGEFCEWCPQAGARAIKEKAIRQRLIRRPGGVYEARVEGDRAVAPQAERLPSAQLQELPEWLRDDEESEAA